MVKEEVIKFMMEEYNLSAEDAEKMLDGPFKYSFINLARVYRGKRQILMDAKNNLSNLAQSVEEEKAQMTAKAPDAVVTHRFVG